MKDWWTVFKKKVKAVSSARKVMASVFCDAQGILLIRYMPKGTTITAGQYQEIFHYFWDDKNVQLLYDSVCLRTVEARMALLQKFRRQVFPHSPYLSDTAPNDYWLSPELKVQLPGPGKHFYSDKEAKVVVNGQIRHSCFKFHFNPCTTAQVLKKRTLFLRHLSYLGELNDCGRK